MSIIKLEPVLKNYLWGGEKLKKLFGRVGDGSIAESWEASVHGDGECTVSGTDGQSFSDYLKKAPFSVDRGGGEFPVLIKYIDAAKSLSVQVHPDNAYARKHENDNGKTEMWYVVSADAGAGIYCGFKRDTGREEFLRKVKDGTVEELLNFIPVKSGDCYLITAGTVHAICASCVICEVQQSSNVTYRVYDYGRKDKDGKMRPLHIDKAADVINFKAFTDVTASGAYTDAENGGGKIRLLTECEYFKCRELKLDGCFSERNTESFTVINVIVGEGEAGRLKLKSGDCIFVPCGEEYNLKGELTAVITSNGERIK